VEVPDIEGAAVKDVSDWLTAGGTCDALMDLVKECPEWIASQEQDNSQELQSLIDKHGEPYYLIERRRCDSPQSRLLGKPASG